MNIILTRLAVAFFLVVLALGCGLAAYASVALEEGISAFASWILAREIHASRHWDYWFFVTVCVVSIAGVIGILLRSRWGRMAALLAFGAAGLWALLIMGFAREFSRRLVFYLG